MAALSLGAAYVAATVWTFRDLLGGRQKRGAYMGLPLMIVLALAAGGAMENATW